MSVSSMTNVAWARRTDTNPPGRGPRDLGEVAANTGQDSSVASAGASAIAAMATYIPVEIITVYIAVLAAIGVSVPSSAIPGATPAPTSLAQSSTQLLSLSRAVVADAAQIAAPPTPSPLLAYVLFLVLTPVVIWGLYAAKATVASKPLPRSLAAWPKWEMLAGTIAFALWAAALPDSPLSAFSWFSPALTGVLALVLSMLIGVFSPIFTRTTLALS